MIQCASLFCTARYMTDGISKCPCITDARSLDPKTNTWVDLPNEHGPPYTINGFQKMGTGVKWPKAARDMRVGGTERSHVGGLSISLIHTWLLAAVSTSEPNHQQAALPWCSLWCGALVRAQCACAALLRSSTLGMSATCACTLACMLDVEQTSSLSSRASHASY